jgi:hypothetical protein
VAIDAPWQFHLGDDRFWADPDFDDSRWEQLTVDKPWVHRAIRIMAVLPGTAATLK